MPGTPAYADALDADADRPAPAARAATTSPGSSTRSGTTGRPKGVMLTHRNLPTMTLCYFVDVDAGRCRATPIVYAAPMSHGAGLYNLAARRARGARHVVPDVGRLRSGRDLSRSRATLRPLSPVRRADHGASASSSTPAPSGARVRRLQDHRLRRRADVRRRHPSARCATMGPRFVADLRPGRDRR